MILKKLFGGDGKFYMELDEKEESKASTPAPAEEIKPLEAVTEAPAPAKSEKPAPPAVESKSEPAPKAKPAKAKKVKEAEPAPQAEPEPQPEPVPETLAAPPAPALVNFAATDLMAELPKPRRRPGPSMGMFKDMARDLNKL
ncbi:MAG: hypothetical protein AAGG02_06180 [Cyanobacteria bacterium P01_H01_bin.15]